MCLPWASDAIAAYLDRDLELTHAGSSAGCTTTRSAQVRPAVVVASGRAAIAERAGDAGSAEAGFSAALDLLGGDGNPDVPGAGPYLTDCGAYIARHGEAGRTRPLLAEALRIAEACGASWHADRARAHWRRAGVRSRTTPAGELTPQEAAVARLVQAGRINREVAHQLCMVSSACFMWSLLGPGCVGHTQ